MGPKKEFLRPFFLLLFCLAIHIFSRNKPLVEQYYSSRIYLQMASAYRILTGWLSISIGDIFYSVLIFLLLRWIIKMYLRYRRKEPIIGGKPLRQQAMKVFNFLAIVYIIFNAFWGINYNRLGIEHQLGLEVKEYGKDELNELTGILLHKVNAWQDSAVNFKKSIPQKKALFSSAIDAYNIAEKKYAFMQYAHPSVKPSLFSYAGNYLGFTGYYNPFSGEAQVNTTVPAFLQPYTTCHEIAHQLGYAKEMEANFVGYLAAKESSNPHFRYSVYLDLYTYAYRNLYYLDSTVAKQYKDSLSAGVKADIKEWRAFNLRHKNPIEPIIRAGYGLFLKSNEQPQGILAYDEVSGFLIAYLKKFGEL